MYQRRDIQVETLRIYYKDLFPDAVSPEITQKNQTGKKYLMINSNQLFFK